VAAPKGSSKHHPLKSSTPYLIYIEARQQALIVTPLTYISAARLINFSNNQDLEKAQALTGFFNKVI
jgi:hypothetical protein